MQEHNKLPTYNILLIGGEAETIHTIRYHLYHALVDDFSDLKTHDKKIAFMKKDTTLTFHQARNFNEVIAETLSSCNGSTPDLVVILRNDYITEQFAKETSAFLLKLQEAYGYKFPKKIISCAYNPSYPYKIDDNLTLQTYRVGLYPDEKKQFCADIREKMGIDEKKPHEEE